MKLFLLLFMLIIYEYTPVFSAALGQASSNQKYTWSTNEISESHQFQINITNNTQKSLYCKINFSGLSAQNTERSGIRQIIADPSLKTSTSKISVIRFQGFRTFTVSSVICTEDRNADK